jgi:hypothetical protein
MPASYPTSIKSFLTVQNQPGDANHVIPDPANPGQTIDLTIDRAKITNEIHDEVIAMEQTIGTSIKPMAIPGTRTMGGEVNALYYGKANGRVDPSNNAIYPLSVPTHNHAHAQLSDLGADDHPQYVRVDGKRGFRAPVGGQWGTQLNHLCPLSQAQYVGWLTSPQVNFVVFTTVAAASSHVVRGPAAQRYRMTGGHFYGRTDENGVIFLDYSAAQFSGVLTVVYMKMPFPGPSAYGYTFQYEEDQLLMLAISNQGVLIQFIEDVVVDRQANISLAWMAVGV